MITIQNLPLQKFIYFVAGGAFLGLCVGLIGQVLSLDLLNDHILWMKSTIGLGAALGCIAAYVRRDPPRRDHYD